MGKGARARAGRAQVIGTGVAQKVPAQQAVSGRWRDDVKPGEHLWTTFAASRVADPVAYSTPGAQFHMDRDNLISVEGPGCLVCEQAYAPGMEKTRCPGEPC